MRRAACWDHYAIVLALITTAVAVTAGWIGVTVYCSAIWLATTAVLCARRLRDTSRQANVLETIATSVLIPPLAVFWRLVGAIRFGAFIV